MQTNTAVSAEKESNPVPKTKTLAAVKEIGMMAVFAAAALIFVAAVLMICIYLFARAIPGISEIGWVNFLFGADWALGMDLFGIGTLVVGTCYSTAGALIVGVPVGLLTATFMAFYCPKWLYKILKPLTNILAGIPSIVYGYFGLKVIVPIVRNAFGGAGFNLITASLVLGVMILPTVISITENSLRAVPKSYYEGAVALGATKERAIFRTVFPAAGSGVMTAIILGLGRAIGETAAITLLCGNVAHFPTSLTDPFVTLASGISSGMGYASGLRLEALIGCAAVLFIFVLIITVLVMLLKRKAK